MKTEPDHLSARERDPIAAMAAVLQADARVEMSILLGSRARGDWGEESMTGLLRRRLELRPKDSARLETCADLPTLERCLEKAAARSAEEALR